MKKSKILTAAVIVNKNWSIIWPMIIIMLMDFLVSITDVYIAGKLGKEIQASVGFVSQIYFVFMVVINGITVGTVSVIARLSGAEKKQEVSEAVLSVTVSSVIAGLFLGTFGIIFVKPGIDLMNIPVQLKTYVSPLLKIYLSGLIFHFFLITSNGVLRSCGKIKYSLVSMTIVCVLNISLNFVLVFHSGIGFYGIILSTVISFIAGSLLNAVQIKKLIITGTRFSFMYFKKMLDIGWPSGLQQLLWNIGGTVLFLIISMLPGNVDIMAAFSSGLRIEAAIYVLAYAFNNANSIITANLLGSGKKSDAFKSGIVTALAGVAVITLQTVFVILNADWIAAAISPNPAVVTEIMRYLYIAMLSEPFMAWAVIISGALNGAGDTRTVSRIVISSQWLVRLPLAYILAVKFNIGQSALWWAMNISILWHAAFVSIRYFRRRWMTVDCC